MSKTQSSPALLDCAGGREENGSPSARKVPSGPISFSLNVQKADDKKLPKMTRWSTVCWRELLKEKEMAEIIAVLKEFSVTRFSGCCSLVGSGIFCWTRFQITHEVAQWLEKDYELSWPEQLRNKLWDSSLPVYRAGRILKFGSTWRTVGKD